MAFTKTLDDCDAYYRPNNHIKGNKWNAYDSEIRNAAFVQAQRDIKLYLNRTLEDPSASQAVYRDDYAVYEQALYMLENGNIQETTGAEGVVKIGRDEESTKDDNWLSPQAIRFLYINRLRMARG